jgi:hypothetical protein
VKVKVGFFSFTEITDPREHRSYNEWHQLDHMPEQFPIPGIAYGERWVRTPACAALHLGDDGPLAATHYLTLYLMTEPLDDTLREFYDRGQHLRALGRFHRDRKSHFSGPLRVLDTAVAPRALIAAEAVPYRPNRGVYVVVEEPVDRVRLDEHTRWLHAEHHATLLAVPGVVGLWTFTTSPAFREHPWDPGHRRVTVVWLDDAPLAVAPRLHARDDVVNVAFAGPLEAIAPWQWDWFDQ